MKNVWRNKKKHTKTHFPNKKRSILIKKEIKNVDNRGRCTRNNPIY